MEIWKELIPGPMTVAYNDERTGDLKRATFTTEYNKYLCDQSNAMLAAGLSIPVPVEHQDMGPMTQAEKAAADLKNNAGWVKKSELRGDRLFQLLSIEDEEMYRKLPKTVRYVSPKINTFTDGNGKRWEGVITHTALTTRPRIVGQKPFDMAAALSVANVAASDQRLTPNSVGGELLSKGFQFSRAGFLKAEKDAFVPMLPGAFAVMAGVKPPKDDEVEEIDEETVDDDGGTEEFEEEESVGKKTKKRSMPMDDDAEKSFEEACQVGFATMIEHLLKVIGMNPPVGMTEQTFNRDLYETLMARAKELAQKGQNADNKPAVDPLAKPKKDMGNNPILQESPPMYASLEEVNKIQDPEKRAIASAYFSLQEERKKDRADLDALKAANEAALKKSAENEKRANAAAFSILEDAKRRREDRIAKVKARLPKKNRDQLDKFLANPAMNLSLADTGSVVDPMTEQIEFAESIADAIPELLREGAAKLSAEPHPAYEGAPMTEARADEIVDILTGGKKK